ncbi:MAG: hypothetical protein ACRCYP_01735 [Alphaproteobacteria bacterium]
MKTHLSAIASLYAIAFSMPAMANPHPAVTGYQMAVQRKLINPRSDYAQKLLGAVNLIRQGLSPEEASRKTGISVRVLNKILEMGSPIPYVDAALPVPSPPILRGASISRALKVANLPPPPKFDPVLKVNPSKKGKAKANLGKEKIKHISSAASAIAPVALMPREPDDTGEFVVGWGFGTAIESATFQKLKFRPRKPGVLRAENVQTLFLKITEVGIDESETSTAKAFLYSPERSELGMEPEDSSTEGIR